MKRSIIRSLWHLVVGVGMVLSFAAHAGSGAIWTSLIDGAAVNHNLYDNKQDVYLNGGPQNQSGGGLPDGVYYFQVTDPSGAVLLSSDAIGCRVVTVTAGVIAGAPSGGCSHPNGLSNSSNGSTPVQVYPFDDTPNKGGEYKVWLTTVDAYNACPSNVNFGFCNADTKTDNFKVKKPGVAHVTACKFEDLDANGAMDGADALIANWPFVATGTSNLDIVATNSDVNSPDFGCVTWTVTDFTDNIAAVTISELTLGDNWSQTAPADGLYPGSGLHTPDYQVSGGVVSIAELFPGDELKVFFGNHRACGTCGNDIPVQRVLVTKDAYPSYKMTWGITKAVDQTRINTGSDSATFNYTVSVTHDAGSEFKVTGTIHVANNSDDGGDIFNMTVTDAVDNGGSCTITSEGGGTIPYLGVGGSVDLTYTCTYSSLPAAGTNTATAKWKSLTNAARTNVGTADVDFANATVADGAVNITDTLGGSLGQVSYSDASPKTFTYAVVVKPDAGSCATKDNTATFTATTGNPKTTGDSNTVTVKACRGADVTVSKDATPLFKRTYGWSLAKDVDKTLVEQAGGGNATFNYTVTATETGFTDSAWQVTGTITVTNPNDWQSITVALSDAIDNGGTCSINGSTSLTVSASSSATAGYTCNYTSAPTALAFGNTATATWNSATYSTPTGTASGSKSGAFGTPTSTVNKTIHVTDAFNGGSAGSLGTLTATDATPYTSYAYTYSRGVTVPANNCVKYANTAAITETGASAGKTVEVCGPALSGALTIGYWQNKNGQGVIAAANQTALLTFLKQFHSFSDAAAPVTSYVNTVMGKATCTSTSNTCNSMLKAQMLATALNVYFSTSGLGAKVVDLTKICKMIDGSGTATCGGSYQSVSSVFGGATSMSVMNMLLYQNTSDPLSDAGAAWYLQNKTNQVMAKDAFDAINNQVVFIP